MSDIGDEYFISEDSDWTILHPREKWLLGNTRSYVTPPATPANYLSKDIAPEPSKRPLGAPTSVGRGLPIRPYLNLEPDPNCCPITHPLHCFSRLHIEEQSPTLTSSETQGSSANLALRTFNNVSEPDHLMSVFKAFTRIYGLCDEAQHAYLLAKSYDSLLCSSKIRLRFQWRIEELCLPSIKSDPIGIYIHFIVDYILLNHHPKFCPPKNSAALPDIEAECTRVLQLLTSMVLKQERCDYLARIQAKSN